MLKLLMNVKAACKTVGNQFCELPFEFKSKKYSTCIDVDNKGQPWCYTNSTTLDWDFCSLSSCSSTRSKRWKSVWWKILVHDSKCHYTQYLIATLVRFVFHRNYIKESTCFFYHTFDFTKNDWAFWASWFQR